MTAVSQPPRIKLTDDQGAALDALLEQLMDLPPAERLRALERRSIGDPAVRSEVETYARDGEFVLPMPAVEIACLLKGRPVRTTNDVILAQQRKYVGIADRLWQLADADLAPLFLISLGQ